MKNITLFLLFSFQKGDRRQSPSKELKETTKDLLESIVSRYHMKALGKPLEGTLGDHRMSYND